MLIIDLDEDVAEELCIKHKESFPFPDISNPLYVAKRVVIADGQVIGAGLLKITSEAVLILDRDTELNVRVMAIMTLIKELQGLLGKFRLDECHAFVRDPNVQKFLERIGFQLSVSGTPLVLFANKEASNGQGRSAANEADS